MSKFLKIIKNLPSKPGVYLFKSKTGQILYVGKAKNLKKRIASYFRKNNLPPDKKSMLEEISQIKHIVVDSEIEALLFELNLIKKYQPKYNIAFKDDKNYQYIKIDKSDDFPRIYTARKKKKDKAEYFGPFPSSKTIKQILNILNRFFHYRECRQKITQEGVVNKKYKICLRYHLERCFAPCVGKISKEKYSALIKQCKMFLEGRKNILLKDLENKMRFAAQKQNFEEAARLRDQIINLKTIISRQITVKEKVEKNPAIFELKKILRLKSKPKRIECFDISNIAGKFATGSMVVFKNGLPAKQEYRRFKIHISGKSNDVAMMNEMLMRRFKHSDWPLPGLIVLDGGKGQLGGALKILSFYHLKIPSIALAKQNEEIYLPPHQKFWCGGVPQKSKLLILPKNSKVLFLFQNLRDEAHRFAIAYHKKLRQKVFLT
ncbi:MAG: excinuclease ABC subunit UvrC [Patescibacteria group bacterium]